MSDTPAVQINPQDIELTQELYKRNLELFKERRRFEELLYRISEGIYATDENYNITIFNHTLEIMTGVKAQDAIGKNVASLIQLTEDDGTPIDIIKYTDPSQNQDTVTKYAVLKNGNKTYYVHIKASLIETKTEGREFLVTISDVTQEKELEKEKDEFISITSHELKTPISIIKSYLWMLESGRGGSMTEKQMLYISKASKGTDRMINLINDMLKVSRMEQGRLEFSYEQIDIKKTIEDTTDEFKLILDQKHLELKMELQETKGVYTDKAKIIEILMNLISNATKYTDEGFIQIKLEPYNNDFAKISVKDTGRGISEEETKKLFQKFQRLDNSYETMAKAGGTGLGLYITKMYMNNLGGSIGVESEGLGKGSTFWILLPFNQETIKKGGPEARL